MKPTAKAGPLGGEGKVLESDETFVGGKEKNAKRGKPEPKKHAVHALVEPGGDLRATHVPDVSAKTLREVLKKHADPKSALHTDDSLANLSIGKDFAEHKTVVHTSGRIRTRTALAYSRPRRSLPSSSVA